MYVYLSKEKINVYLRWRKYRWRRGTEARWGSCWIITIHVNLLLLVIALFSCKVFCLIEYLNTHKVQIHAIVIQDHSKFYPCYVMNLLPSIGFVWKIVVFYCVKILVLFSLRMLPEATVWSSVCQSSIWKIEWTPTVVGIMFKKRSALAVNCWVIIHCLEVSCKGDQITSLKHKRFICLKLTNTVVYLSRLMTKPTKWHVHPAKTQISLGFCPVWSESSLFAWRKLGPLGTQWGQSKDWSD